ncbi:hypothetical protein GPJ56_000340 [Histomonas meleagridis]|uniref:uncharacterized protein n=1 Tax=Histomonas meleagridis TaxID=135588 RepID=UPI00355A0F2F|nr:hypothetical protein GPJ56_000340 [Histomonas meleagridis]KAH0798387.1 hypothetical protein GO595_008779 [Histomonas meleagridis]
MSKNIVAAFRELYARYIELFFELCVKDYKFLLMLPPYYKNFPDITDKIPVQPLFEPIQSDQGKLIIEFIVFRDHQIVACYTNPSASPLEPGDVFQISLFERMETRTTTFDENAPIEEPTADSIVHRGGNVHFDHNVERCFLSKIQYGKSPYVLIFVTKEEKPTPELTHKIHTVSKDFCAKLNRYLSDKHKPKPSIYMTGIVHYILVNRSNGTYREPENIDPPKSNNDIEARQYYLCEKIKRNMVSFGLKAFQSRYIAALRNEIHFQYTYEIVVRNTKGQNVVLDKSVLSKYNSSGETESYTKFIKYLQGKLNDNGVEVYELYTAYLGVMPAKDVIKANAMLLDKIIEGKHKNKQ